MKYNDKALLEKVNELYAKVKGDFIGSQVLFSGKFLSILRETYRLPNDKIVNKEKVVKNKGKNAVIVVAQTEDSEYIVSFQSRLRDKLIAEFTSGYIEDGEDILEAAKRELKEETGYVTDDIELVDWAYTSPGTDNSIIYITIANNCVNTNVIEQTGTELVNFGLFTAEELDYFIDNNIISGAMNKLAYYNLIKYREKLIGKDVCLK